MSNVVLQLITKINLSNYEDIKRLKEWRKKNQFAYTGNYKVTHNSIKKWLKNSVIDNQDRFLFWVIADGEKIGHMGIKNIKKDSIEIDNVGRGREEYKGAMSTALKQLIDMYPTYTIWLRVLPYNLHAIKFYIKNGFEFNYFDGEFERMIYAK